MSKMLNEKYIYYNVNKYGAKNLKNYRKYSIKSNLEYENV